ncbi:hypothetical protein SISSUDRAFT_71049 [Sistotremastrum suecicum HHB10207 ss-3]|uniref:Uncharacterized protein n=1 Tax=Sistotremastrum suecicum HHB10207 ss-3 TaxID=1314776 RepID=A0A166BHL4_9AGAM|nr:hypothetical protein SISSUDRAFT_71049 [Sistotremastrum suecicum HHB10207 ss-3]
MVSLVRGRPDYLFCAEKPMGVHVIWGVGRCRSCVRCSPSVVLILFVRCLLPFSCLLYSGRLTGALVLKYWLICRIWTRLAIRGLFSWNLFSIFVLQVEKLSFVSERKS